jgi:hypothetical protein
MFKSNSKLLLSLIVGVAVAGVAGTFWLGSIENNIQAVASDSKAMAMTSVWDKETEPNYSGVKEVTVYRSPNCGCCGEWVKHMQKHGFKITDIKTDRIEAIKQKYNVPQNLASCHTSVIDGYVMEGHIPADDIKRFVASKPKQAGLAVPAMPLGTPGMETAKKQPFAIASFNKDGEIKIFKEYQSY